MLAVQGVRGLEEEDMEANANIRAVVEPTFTWTLNNFAEQIKEATDNGLSTNSLPFYTNGYKLRLRLYPNGDGPGEGTHLSLYLQVMRGEQDEHLAWPLRARVSMVLQDLVDGRFDLVERFTPDPALPSVQRPCKDFNRGVGFPQFVLRDKLYAQGSRYLQNDRAVIDVLVDLLVR